MILKILSRLILLSFICLALSSFTLSQNNTRYIKLISPNGGERWEANSTQTITWQSSGVAKVKIEYSLSGGMDWHTIVSSVDASLNQYFWNVPNVQIGEVLIRISDASNFNIYDRSNGFFKIYMKNSIKKSKSLNKITTLTSSTSLKIMPLGNSITEGAGSDPWQVGWRLGLFNLLTNKGYNFKFIGEQESGLDSSPPGPTDTTYDFYINGRHHEGHGGIEVGRPEYISSRATMLDTITSILESNLTIDGNIPDIILFHIGTNDLDNGNNPSQIANQIDTVLGKIDTFATNNDHSIKTIFAKIIYNSHAASGAQNTMNTALQTKADSLINIGRNVSLIDMFSVLDKAKYDLGLGVYFSDTVGVSVSNYNDVHPSGYQPSPPSLNGYYKMAGAWYTKLQTILPLLQVKVFLQGPYNSSSGLMDTTLRFNNDIPATSPYQDSNNNSAYLNGSNYVVVPYTIPSDITDWIQIEIRSSDGTTVIESKSCFLRDDGQVIDPDGLSENISLGSSVVNPLNTYYIVIRHRNHLAVMSADLVELNGVTSYDFTTGNGQFYGGSAGAIEVETGVWGMIAGDTNGDGQVNASDRNATWNSRNQTGYLMEDVSLDGQVNATDRNTTWNNRNLITQVLP